MSMRIDTSQWRDKTEAPAIVWVYIGVWELAPVAVDDTHENDLHDELTRAFYAVNAYQTAEELEEDASFYDLTPAQIWELYSRGDYSAEKAGLPTETYAEGCNEDGSDAIIYVDEATWSTSRRETLEEATPYLDPEDVAEIYRAILAARKEYDC